MRHRFGKDVLMGPSRDSLTARRRRLDSPVEDVRVALHDTGM